jgi:transposase
VARWLDDEFPRIVRGAFARQADLVFLDESGFFRTPTVRRTLAPRGRTPVLKTRTRRDKWSAISCITLSPVSGRPGLYFELFDYAVGGVDVVGFLAAVRRRVGPRTVVWDRNQIHSKSKVVRSWLAKHPEVVAEEFPGYVPDLNPDEGVWGWTKYARLANWAPHDKQELRAQVVDQLAIAKRRPDLLRGFIRQTGLLGVSRAA